ncbi:MAG TPA: universal stress protein [Longimicrobiaceae bacterium]|nr:universal stress protein [Longimicrobiaceae bacterium]
MSGTILVATDGRPDADGAVRVGAALAEREAGAAVELVAVLVPREFSALAPSAPVPDGYVVLQDAQARDLQLAVGRQLARVGRPEAGLATRVEVGSPASAIAERARAADASILAMGRQPLALAHASARGDTALQVVRLCPAPLLIVPPDATEPPRSALAAIDFGPLSARAAWGVAATLPEGGHLYLLHVTWEATETEALPSLGGWKREYDERAEARLEALAREVAAALPVQARAILARGDVAHEVLAIADRMNVDAVAAGRQGGGAGARVLVGTVATALVRRGRRTVMVVPPTAAEAESSRP